MLSFFVEQTQRKLEQEGEARRRVEGVLADREREIDSIRRRGQEMNRDSAQSSERLALVEKSVRDEGSIHLYLILSLSFSLSLIFKDIIYKLCFKLQLFKN